MKGMPLRGCALSMSASEPAIKTFLEEFVGGMVPVGQKKDETQIAEFFDKFMDPSSVMIRPSGNPLDLAGWKGMFAMPDILFESEVLSFDSIKEIAGGNAAVVTYTTRSKFSFKGMPNDDVAKFSATLEKVGDAWKIVHLHRATGQPPEE